MEKVLILIVEDEPIIGKDIQGLLQSLGYEVNEVITTGEEAILKAVELQPDLILMDIALSGKIDGIEAVKKIKEELDVPIIYLTAHTEENTFDRARETEPYGYLVKPVGRNDFYTAIETALHRHQMEISLQESKNRYRTLIANANEAILVAQNGIIKFANPKAIDLFGYTPEEYASRPFVEFIHPDDREMVIQRHLRRLKGEDFEKVYTFRMIDKEGNIRWLEINATLIDWNGEPATLNFLSDITKRKWAEEELKKSEQEKAAILDSMTDLVTYQDNDMRIVWANRSAAESIDLELEDLVGRYCYELWHYRKEPCVDCPIVIAHKTREKQESEITTPDGRAWRIRGNPIFAEDGSVAGIVEVTQNITEQKKTEELIQASLHEKEILLKEIHHRVNNNFQIITSLLNMQESRIKDDELLKIFKISRDRIRAMSLIHERLYQSEDLTRINFAEYINIIVKGLYQTYLCNPDRIDLQIEAREVKLGIDQAIPCGLIINELVTNAIKHAFPQELKRRGRISIKLKEKTDNLVELMVDDNGIGMPDDMDITDGRSLGLKLVPLLVENQLSGELKLDRKKGTRFTITFQKQV